MAIMNGIYTHIEKYIYHAKFKKINFEQEIFKKKQTNKIDFS